MKPFEIIKNSKKYDYRLGHLLDEKEIRAYFEKLGYKIEKLWMGMRHQLGIIHKNNQKLLLKLATSEGQSFLIENEISWNQQVYKLLKEDEVFCVPKIFETGKFKEEYLWEITEYWQGEMLSNYPQSKKLTNIVYSFTSITRVIEVIGNLDLSLLPLDLLSSSIAPKNRFFEKTKSWFIGIPEEICQRFKVDRLLKIVEKSYKKLSVKPRHGDFAPWHMIKLKNGKIGLFDAEHAIAKGVECYDFGYFIQRVYSVLEDSKLANEIFNYCRERSRPASRGEPFPTDKIKTVLSARAIGGFLDESLTERPNYEFHDDFMNWVLQI